MSEAININRRASEALSGNIPYNSHEMPRLSRSFHGVSMFGGGDNIIEYTNVPRQIRSAELKTREKMYMSMPSGGLPNLASGALSDPYSSGLMSFVDMKAERKDWGYFFSNFWSSLIPGLLIVFMSAIPFATITGIWAEIPLIYTSVPENNAISPIIGTAYNLGNIFPFLYVALRPILPRESIMFAILTFLSAAPGVVLGLYWNYTAEVFGSEHSVILLAMSFVCGAIGTTINVILYSYVAKFQPWVTTAAAVGMGLCSVLIAGLGAAQNVKGLTHKRCALPNGAPHNLPMHHAVAQPRFSINLFFFILAGIHVLGFIAFIFIEFSPIMKNVTNPLEFLEELDRQRQLDAEGKSAEADEEERLSLLNAHNADPLYDDSSLPMDSERDFSIQRMSGEIIRARADTAERLRQAEFKTPGTKPIITEGEETITEGGEAETLYQREENDVLNSSIDQPLLGEPFKVPQKSYFRKLIAAGASPVLNQLVKALMVYFVNPGLLTYLTNDAQLISYMIVTAQVSNMLGRFATGFYTTTQVTLLNVFCTFFFAYETVIACWTYPSFAPDWILVPVTGIYAFANGYVSTVVYLVADNNAEREFGEDSLVPARLIRRWITLVNQLGSVSGSFLCAFVANQYVLKAKLEQCTPSQLTTSAATAMMPTMSPQDTMAAGLILAMAMNPPF